MTGGLEIVSAALITLPADRGIGMVLGALIIAAAIATVLRHRELSHAAPLSMFAAVLVIAAMTS